MYRSGSQQVPLKKRNVRDKRKFSFYEMRRVGQRLFSEAGPYLSFFPAVLSNFFNSRNYNLIISYHIFAY